MARPTLADLRENPKQVTYRELLMVLEDHEWSVRERTKHGAIVQKGKRTLMIPRPHGAQLVPVYVRKVIRSIEEDDE